MWPQEHFRILGIFLSNSIICQKIPRTQLPPPRFQKDHTLSNKGRVTIDLLQQCSESALNLQLAPESKYMRV